MKKFLFFIIFFTFISCGFLLSISAEAANVQNRVDLEVTMPDSVKIGQECYGIQPEVSLKDTTYLGKGNNLTIGSVEGCLSGGKFVQKSNLMWVNISLYPEKSDSEPGKGMPELPEPYDVEFTINDNIIPSYYVYKEYDENGGFYRISYDDFVDLSDRTTYSILPDSTTYECGYYVSVENMPSEAEAGVEVIFNAEFRSDLGLKDDPFEAKAFKINGEVIQNDDTFVMPASDVMVSADVVDKYKDYKYVSEVDVEIDFDDESFYYGKKVPKDEDFLNAIKVTCNTPGVDIYVKHCDVSAIDDYEQDLPDDYVGYNPWTGNKLLSFWISVEDGYMLSNPYLSDIFEDESGNFSNPLGDWLKENFVFRVNGTELHYALDWDMMRGMYYSDGYFFENYYVSPRSIEVHVWWYVTITTDQYDLSEYEAGDIVTIHDSSFEFDGYFPVAYILEYEHPDKGYIVDTIFGKKFTMPESIGKVELSVAVIRGEFNRQIPEGESYEYVYPMTYVLQFDHVDGKPLFLDISGRVLSDTTDETILYTKCEYDDGNGSRTCWKVTFGVPENFNSGCIALFHTESDYYGYYEFCETYIDTVNNTCTIYVSYIEHYHSPIYVPSLSPTEVYAGHAAYYMCGGCDSWFWDEWMCDEIFDKTLIYVGYEPKGYSINLKENSSFKINYDNGFVSGISVGKTIEDIKNEFEDGQEISFKDKDGNVLNDSSKIGTGTKVQLIVDEEVVAEISVVIKGDVDGDGDINVADTLTVYLHLTGKNVLDGVFADAAAVHTNEIQNYIIDLASGVKHTSADKYADSSVYNKDECAVVLGSYGCFSIGYLDCSWYESVEITLFTEFSEGDTPAEPEPEPEEPEPAPGDSEPEPEPAPGDSESAPGEGTEQFKYLIGLKSNDTCYGYDGSLNFDGEIAYAYIAESNVNDYMELTLNFDLTDCEYAGEVFVSSNLMPSEYMHIKSIKFIGKSELSSEGYGMITVLDLMNLLNLIAGV